MKKPLLILDLDGVLILTVAWRKDPLHADGYSDFEKNCVENLNELLELGDFEICLSSTRRKAKTLGEFNRIFQYRGIRTPISQFVPVYEDCVNRKEEIEKFILTLGNREFLVIDDDKSMHEFSQPNQLVLTEFHIGLGTYKLLEAKEKMGLS